MPAGAGSIDNFGMHPAALDAALQTLAAAFPSFDPEKLESEVYMPIGIDRFRMRVHAGGKLRSHAQLDAARVPASETQLGHITVQDAAGHAIAQLHGLRLKRAPKSSLVKKAAAASIDNCFYEMHWEAAPVADSAHRNGTAASYTNGAHRNGSSNGNGAAHVADALLVFVDQAGLAAQLQSRLLAQGSKVVLVRPGSQFQRLSSSEFEIRPYEVADFQRLLQRVRIRRRAAL